MPTFVPLRYNAASTPCIEFLSIPRKRSSAEANNFARLSAVERPIKADSSSRPADFRVLPGTGGASARLQLILNTSNPVSPSDRVKTWASWKGYDSGALGEAHEDVLIVAGDISSSLERAAETLTDLKERFDEVRGWRTRTRRRRKRTGGALVFAPELVCLRRTAARRVWCGRDKIVRRVLRVKDEHRGSVLKSAT